MRRIAVFHPHLVHGGSESRALWMLQALRGSYDVTLVTAGDVDLPRLNRYYGTDLREADFSIARPTTGFWSGYMLRGNAFRGAVLEAYARRVAADFDLCMSAYNPMDFGVPGVQFLADFSFLPGVRRRFHGDIAAFERRGVIGAVGRRGYGLLTRLARGRDSSDLALRPDDVVIANSEFAADVFSRETGRVCDKLIYPPVSGPLWQESTDSRDRVFVSIGRISPEKRIEDQIAILRAVRLRGHEVDLHILGGPVDGAYAERVRGLVKENRGWVVWAGRVEGAAKWSALRSARFGIHTCIGEAFGISTAEMTRAGCVPFVPSVGGPAEIVGEPLLAFSSEAEAVERICTVLSDPALERRLRARLVSRGAQFSVERFCSDVLSLVQAALP